MSYCWINVKEISFKNLLLLEREQISWFPGWLPEAELAIALRANESVAWYFRHKCSEVNDWVDKVFAENGAIGTDEEMIREAEIKVMQSMNDLLTYAVDPGIYDKQAFLNWDSAELSGRVDFSDKIVLDIGAGTGRLAFIAAEKAETVYAVEPVENLRRYIKTKAKKLGFSNVFVADGLIEDIPFPNEFADVVMGGHVFGDHPESEFEESMRVIKRRGMLIFCPGNNDVDDARHEFLVAQGCEWSRFEEPEDGWKRKYWVNKGD
ncbi:MAG: class I SAM-dependent methyltransferase [Chloroflexi bacterium]|jgi:ubiquinone/menaquinone biosynthesis C-methylase UbiE|nr:class I SAM-dependent methyltransferase [Chloroflexota bacterium]MBT3670411.1 class I SAM-dependent methyltransferase [Chloroflexota bacterium]MBT4003213.1 class I SAM-dependent methyltransferase [Chloroflexota bacterium]MBT4304626.1 class I SAM-dependent methyltransferase [Chloroflexota bacterium]MBT4532557.1 class I SAM-dependent methyltransferase [Chloroflexota bacterium]